jgi:hypothetical protein
MFHQVSDDRGAREWEMHMGDVWKHPQIFWEMGRRRNVGIPSIGVPVSKNIKIIMIMIKYQQ